MANFSKITWLTTLLIVFLLVAGVFAYQWWQVKEEIGKQIEQNENLIKQVDELQKEIEELRSAKEVIEETAEWKTYKSEEYGYEIKYPSGWKMQSDHPGLVDFLEKDTFTTTEFSVGVNIWGAIGAFVGWTVQGREITVENIQLYPTIYLQSEAEPPVKHIKIEEIQEYKNQPLGNDHLVYASMCVDRENLKYLRDYCEMEPGIRFYQFSLCCKGDEWEGVEGIKNCNQLFTQIVSSFKFIK